MNRLTAGDVVELPCFGIDPDRYESYQVASITPVSECDSFPPCDRIVRCTLLRGEITVTEGVLRYVSPSEE
jgi:hypothetical protein